MLSRGAPAMKESKVLKNYTFRTGFGYNFDRMPADRWEIVRSSPRQPARSDAAVVRLQDGRNGMSSMVGKKMTRGPKYPTSAT